MNPPAPLLITKSSGEMAPYDAEKLRRSLLRAGAEHDAADRIVANVSGRITQGMSTRSLYRMAFRQLHKRSHRAAARYRLKQGILDLGPSGFPFERFVARILEHDGYSVKVGEVVQGQCVNHEVDVVADKDAQHFLVECKYHNTPGRICDVKVPLYIKARFLDVAEQWHKQPANGSRTLQGWLVTNTRFTSDALRYGQCAGLQALGQKLGLGHAELAGDDGLATQNLGLHRGHADGFAVQEDGHGFADVAFGYIREQFGALVVEFQAYERRTALRVEIHLGVHHLFAR